MRLYALVRRPRTRCCCGCSSSSSSCGICLWSGWHGARWWHGAWWWRSGHSRAGVNSLRRRDLLHRSSCRRELQSSRIVAVDESAGRRLRRRHRIHAARRWWGGRHCRSRRREGCARRRRRGSVLSLCTKGRKGRRCVSNLLVDGSTRGCARGGGRTRRREHSRRRACRTVWRGWCAVHEIKEEKQTAQLLFLI